MFEEFSGDQNLVAEFDSVRIQGGIGLGQCSPIRPGAGVPQRDEREGFSSPTYRVEVGKGLRLWWDGGGFPILVRRGIERALNYRRDL